MPGIFRRLEGRHGRIEIPDLGATVAVLASYTLIRRSDAGREANFYDLTAVCSMVVSAMLSDPDYPWITAEVDSAGNATKVYEEGRKIILVRSGPSRMRRLAFEEQGPGQRMALSGRSLMMERVALI